MRFKLHDVVTLIGHANDDMPMVVIAKGVEGSDWILLSGTLLVSANEDDMCYWCDRHKYTTEKQTTEKKRTIRNLWGLL